MVDPLVVVCRCRSPRLVKGIPSYPGNTQSGLQRKVEDRRFPKPCWQRIRTTATSQVHGLTGTPFRQGFFRRGCGGGSDSCAFCARFRRITVRSENRHGARRDGRSSSICTHVIRSCGKRRCPCLSTGLECIDRPLRAHLRDYESVGGSSPCRSSGSYRTRCPRRTRNGRAIPVRN